MAVHSARRLPQRTKIVATLGPATKKLTQVRALLRAGVNVFRINFSHGTQEEHEKTIKRVRRAANLEKRPAAVLADLQGPKIRVGKLKDKEPLFLQRGDSLVIVSQNIEGGPGRIGCTYARLCQEVKPGERVLLDDGAIELRVNKVVGKEITTRVVVGGILREHKGINLPGTNILSASFTRKDRQDLDFALEHDVDFVALSFVRNRDDLLPVKRRIRRADSRAEVIAKIERPEAVKKIDGIIEEADGIMIARGDMGVELGAEAVPPIQKRIIEKCVAAAKPVITATQMLETMVENPHPTRAEASDVANAIYDGTSAVMLSAETAAGKHPILAVRTMARIARQAEKDVYKDAGHPVRRRITDLEDERGTASIEEAAVGAAAHAALRTRAKAIVIFTESGRTAKIVARERLPIPIFACTPITQTVRRLCLQWGVIPVLNKRARDVERLRRQTEKTLAEQGLVKEGQRVVFIAGTVDVAGATNMIQIVDIGSGV